MFHWLQNASELNCKNAREKPLQFESQIKSGLTDETFTQYNTLSTCGGTVETVCKAPLKQGNVVVTTSTISSPQATKTHHG